MKRFLIFVSCLTFSLTSTVYAEEIPASPVIWTLEMKIFDIGKADSILLTTKNHTVLIDTGEQKHGETIVKYLKEQNISAIDYLILSHFDNDHLGGADTVLKQITVKNILQPDFKVNKESYVRYMDVLDEVDVQPVSLTETVTFQLDDVEFTVYPPEKTAYDLVNDYSLVARVQHGEVSMLFTGDIVIERLKEMLALGNIKCDFLKVPHHGIYRRFDDQNFLWMFLYAVEPDYAVVTCAENTTFSKYLLDYFHKKETDVYYTKNGGVHGISDGTTLLLQQEKAE